MPSNEPATPVRRRQIGAERSTTPLPTVHPKPSKAKLTMSTLSIVLTILFWMTYIVYTVVRQTFYLGGGSLRFTVEAISYAVVVTFLTFSALMYLLARHGALLAFRDHERVPRAELDRHFGSNQSTMTVLVPSYAEETSVIRQTAWSAALQEYPSMRVVLLLDDPPFPTDPVIAARLERSRSVAAEMTLALSEPRTRFNSARLDFELGELGELAGTEPSIDAVRQLAYEYYWAVDWLDGMAANERREDHVDEFFVSQVLLGLSGELSTIADALTAAAPPRAETADGLGTGRQGAGCL